MDPNLYTSFVSSIPISPIGIYRLMSNNISFYKSPYSGGFAVQDTVSLPRPCATTAVNIT